MAADGVEVEVGERLVRISSPERVYFPARGATKLDLVRLLPERRRRDRRRAARAAVHAAPLPDRRRRATRCTRSGSRPGRRDWVETVRLDFPRYGRHADELCVTELASVIWAVQMSTVEFHPWNSRRADTEQPDEWRIDLDPMPGASSRTVRRVAGVAHEVLDELGAAGWPKTSGGKGLHIYVRIEPRWGFARGASRRAGLRPRGRAPGARATSPPPGGARTATRPRLFVDYNQNARDHTIAAPTPCAACREARVSTPITWDEIDEWIRASSRSPPCRSVSPSFGDLHEGIDDHALRLTPCWSGPSATNWTSIQRSPETCCVAGAGPRTAAWAVSSRHSDQRT